MRGGADFRPLAPGEIIYLNGNFFAVLDVTILLIEIYLCTYKEAKMKKIKSAASLLDEIPSPSRSSF
jgi:hypothetical protein